MLASAKGRSLVAHIPKNRVLTETDSPFAAVEGRRSSPTDVSRAIPQLAILWNIDSSETAAQVAENASALID
jgi:TatD DNase family protein